MNKIRELHKIYKVKDDDFREVSEVIVKFGYERQRIAIFNKVMVHEMERYS